MISIQICINNDNIASVFIVSPPSYNVGRDEPNNTLIALLASLLYHKLLKSLIFYNFSGTPLWIEIGWRSLLLTYANYKKTAIHLRRNIMKCRFFGGVLRSSLPPSDAILRSSLVAFPNYLNHTNTIRAQRAPNKHYEIPFVRSMPCSSRYIILLRTPQAT